MVNHKGTELLYARSVGNGVGSFLVDLATGRQRRPLLADVRQRASLSTLNCSAGLPMTRYLAFAWAPKGGRFNQHVAICDGASTALHCSFAAPGPVRQAVWLTTNSLALLDNAHGLSVFDLDTATNLGRFGSKGLVKVRQLGRGRDTHEDAYYALKATCNHVLAYFHQGNLWTLDLAANRARQLTHLTGATLQWFDHSPGNGEFLFHVTDKGARRPVPCRFKPEAEGTGKLTRFAHPDIYKAQWVQGGAGIAYVDTRGNRNCLVIDTADKTLCTNLFLNGHVRNYSVAPSGEAVYAVAAMGDEPLSIWEYNIGRRILRNVVPALEGPFTASRVTGPTRAAALARDGAAIPYSLFRPQGCFPTGNIPCSWMAPAMTAGTRAIKSSPTRAFIAWP